MLSGDGASITSWNLTTGRIKRLELDYGIPGCSTAFTSDLEYFTHVSAGNIVQLRDLESGLVAAKLDGQKRAFCIATISPDKKVLVLCHQDGELALREVASMLARPA